MVHVPGSVIAFRCIAFSFWSWSDRWLYSAITVDQKQDWSWSWT